MGWERLFSCHLVEASEEFFPDPWSPSVKWIRNSALRMLALAGLGDVDVSVMVGQGVEVSTTALPGVGATGYSTTHRGAAAWFAGIEGGTCFFGVDEHQLLDPESALPTLAHEVAHAFRHRHGLDDGDPGLEELRTDVTTVYLGFGIITTNGAYRFRKSGEQVGTIAYTTWSHATLGYLSPDSMAFLLAAHIHARPNPERESRRIRKLLEPNQGAVFSAAFKRLGRDDALRRRLRIEDGPMSPAPQAVEELYAHIERLAKPAAAKEAYPPPKRLPPERVFRVRENRALSGIALGGIAGGAVAISVTTALSLVPSAGGLMFMIACGLGWWIGSRRRHYVCSNPECRSGLASSPDVCPGCGGRIAGELENANHRLAAEEALDEGLVSAGPDDLVIRSSSNGLFRVFIGMFGAATLALAGAAYSSYSMNEARVFLIESDRSASVSVDGSRAVEGRHGVVSLWLGAGERKLEITDGGRLHSVTVHVTPDSRHAIRASKDVCFVELDASGRYGVSGPGVGNVRERLDTDDVALAAGVYFPDDLPKTVSGHEVEKVRTIHPCPCSLLSLTDDDLKDFVKRH